MRKILIMVVLLALAGCETYLTTLPCDCSGNYLDCADFATQGEAQACYDYCIQVVGEDVHNMDGDGNGLVCERLGSPTTAAPASSPPPPGDIDLDYDETGEVVRIVDGDTIDVVIDGVEETIRYIGVNTPERDELCFENATLANADLVEGQQVFLQRDVSNTDRFDRLLRYVAVQGADGELIFVNAELVREGWAEAVRFEPDVAFYDEFVALEAAAEADGRGCHATGVFDD